ncbi:MAG: thrombospondin type 3 repeat-containing protein, partial [Duncaniella sp.]|nr:thrombospondin type 3 repeat-containing protein [Duncaniella sp.]
IEYIYTTTHSAEDAYATVLANAGASLKRDALDEMIVNDARENVAKSGTGSGLGKGFINTPNDVTYPEGVELDGVLPLLKSTEAPTDTDGDGIPDEWETANGLNPEDATDGAKASASGYTNLELYMNSLVAHIMDAGNVNGKMLNGELTYADDAVELPVYGTEDSAIEDVIMSPAVENGDERTFNILGVEVKNPTAPGVYIRGGKKFIVR